MRIVEKQDILSWYITLNFWQYLKIWTLKVKGSF